MDAYKINALAFDEYEHQNFYRAQQLFLENVRKNPCHETFNNWGYFLVTEGICHADKKWRRASYLGMKYLQMARSLRKSARNLCAIATAIKINITRHLRREEGLYTYQNALEVLQEADERALPKTMMYNRLGFLYRADADAEELLADCEQLTQTYLSEESALLHLHVLCRRGKQQECLAMMQKYSVYVDEADKMVLYYLCGEHEASADCFKGIFPNFILKKSETAMLFESLIQMGRLEEADAYAKHLSSCGVRICGLSSKTIIALRADAAYRKEMIKEYRYQPPFVAECCYFGCPNHKTLWQ